MLKMGAARQEEKRRTTEKVCGCSEGGCEDGWCVLTEEEARDRVRWRQMICCGDP